MDRLTLASGRHTSPQTVNDALAAANGALRQHKTIAVDEAGSLRPGRAEGEATDFRMIFTRLFTDPVDPGATLHQKMVAEVALQMNIDGDRAAYIVNKRIGALTDIRSAIDHRDLAPIQERWSKLASELSRHTEEIRLTQREEMRLKHREMLLEKFSAGFPAELPLSALDGHAARLKRPFSEGAQAQIIDDYQSLEQDRVDAGTGLAPQFVADAHRATFIFVDQHGKEQVFTQGPREAVIKALRSFAHDDQGLAACLSKMINQRGLAGLYMQMYADFPTPAGDLLAAAGEVAASRSTANQVSIYRLARNGDGHITISTDYYDRQHLLELVSGREKIAVNRWEGWTKAVSPDNFSIHLHCALRASEADLQANRIKVTFVEPPTAEFRYQIAWELLDAKQG